GEWSFHARVRNGAHLAAASPSHPEMKIAPDGGDLVLTGREEFTKVDRDVVLELTEPSANVAAAQPVRWSGAEHEGKRYRMLRYRPELPGTPVRQRRDWVFVFDACG